MALGAGCNENGNINAVLGEGVYNVSDVLTLDPRQAHHQGGRRVRQGLSELYELGRCSAPGNFEFNGGVTGIPYADFLSGDVYGWYVYDVRPDQRHMHNSALFASDDYKVSSHVTLNLGSALAGAVRLGSEAQSFRQLRSLSAQFRGWRVVQGSDPLWGTKRRRLMGELHPTTRPSKTPITKQFAPRIGVAWSPREKWSVRASYGIFDAPRDAENYTDGALGLGFNPHNEGNGGYVNGSYAFKLATGPPPGTVVYPDAANSFAGRSPTLAACEYYPRNMPTVYVQTFLLSVQHEFAGGILLDTSYVYTRGRNLNFQTDINQAPVTELGCTGYNCGNPNPVFNSISAAIYDGWSNYNALQVRLQKRMSYGLNFQVNYALSKSLDTGTGTGHGSGVDIYQNAYNPAANYGLSDFNSTHTVVGQVTYELPFGSGRQFALHGPLDQIAGGWRLSVSLPVALGRSVYACDPELRCQRFDPGLAPSIAAGSTLYPDLVGNPYVSNSDGDGWFNPAAFADPALWDVRQPWTQHADWAGILKCELQYRKAVPACTGRA